jgi:uncharacterized protein
MGERYVLSKYVIASDMLSDADLSYPLRVLFSTRQAKPFVVSEAVWQAITHHQHDKLPASVLAILMSEKILVAARENELKNVVDENREEIQNAGLLYHVIEPSAACQLGCGYCGQQHSGRKLTSADQDKVLNRLENRIRSGGYSALSVGWFGGEPLLGLDVIRQLTPKLLSLARTYNLPYSAKIVTNGVLLTPEVALELYDTHSIQHAEITLDGVQAIHDMRRVTKGGGPSFDKIFSNLLHICAYPEVLLGLTIRCNVDQHNWTHVSELIDFLADHGLNKRASFYVAPIHSWGNNADVHGVPYEEFAALEIEWLAQLYNRGFKTGILPKRRKVVCLAVQRDGELTDAYGTVFNCTEVTHVPVYGNPNRYAIDGPGISRPDAPPFRNFNEEILNGRQPSCASCVMLPVCGGACPKLWQEGKIPCPSAKSNIRDRLALWYATQKDIYAIQQSSLQES